VKEEKQKINYPEGKHLAVSFEIVSDEVTIINSVKEQDKEFSGVVPISFCHRFLDTHYSSPLFQSSVPGYTALELGEGRQQAR
jgi:hypothetical protein